MRTPASRWHALHFTSALLLAERRTRQAGRWCEPLQALVAETVIEAVEKVSGQQLQREHHRLKMPFKATPGCDRPSTLCMRSSSGSKAAAAGPAAQQESQQAPGNGKRSGFSFPRTAQKEASTQAAAATSPVEEPQAAVSPEVGFA